MSDKEISKALMRCAAEDCEGCPYIEKSCQVGLMIDAYKAIDRKQEEIEFAKNETLKEFVNQHKKIMREYLYNDSTDFLMKWCEYETSTDNLLTEIVGDKNA